MAAVQQPGMRRQIEVVAPSVLPLSLGWLAGAPLLLSVALQHPPLQLTLLTGATLGVSGARADLAHGYAERLLARHGLDRRVTLELELAVPSLMGLGSASSLALALSAGLARWSGRDLDAATLAADCGLTAGELLLTALAAQGGLGLSNLAGGAAAPQFRRMLQHPDRQAWAFVLVLPRLEPPPGPEFEATRLAAALQAADQLDQARAEVATAELLGALDHDDIARFGAALSELQHVHAAALRSSGALAPLSDWEQQICAQLRASGAVACGRSLGGAALFGLIEGDHASIAARQALRLLVAPEAGRVMAAITDNAGLRVVVRGG
jgi:predicted sugar kinase